MYIKALTCLDHLERYINKSVSCLGLVLLRYDVDMSAKRKRVVIPIEQKIQAIYRLENGESSKDVAEDLNVGTSTICEWKKNKHLLIQFATKTANSTVQRKTMRKFENEELNEAVFLWFIQEREKGTPLSGPAIQEKARALALQFGESSKPFTASSGWLERWRSRYGIRKLNISEGKLSNDESSVNVFINEIKSLLSEYTREQIFYADESALDFAPGSNKIKERITILACANASANLRLPILVIGKKPYDNICQNALPVVYKNERSALLSGDLLKKWFDEEFAPSVTKFLESKNLPLKALLIYAPSYSDVSELKNGEILTHFLPSNIKNLLRPANRSVMDCLKRNYRQLLLQSLANEHVETTSLDEVLKRISLKDVINWLAEAWNSVQESTLKQLWNRLIIDEVSETHSGNTSDEISTERLSSLIKQIPGCNDVDKAEVAEWLNGDDTLYELSDQEIVEVVLEDTDEGEQVSEIFRGGRRVTPEEGFNALEVALNFVEQCEEATPEDVGLIKRWLNIAARKKAKKERQEKLFGHLK